MQVREKQVTILTGAGVSSESGIPTFRGVEGYWTIGSTNYHPQEMATSAMFVREPWEVWQWYLYRARICKKALPNSGHMAIVTMEQTLQDKFSLITQNVDNLHLQAGNSLNRTYQIHGNIFYMRCSANCQPLVYPLPQCLLSSAELLTVDEKKLLYCPHCGSNTRPHILWFDESYNEHHYKYESALKIANATDMLIVAGTSGATTLPNQIMEIVYQNGGTIIDINIEKTHFSKMAIDSINGKFFNYTCSEGLGKLLDEIKQS
jgi:NAD-dependent deacetylase